MAKQNYMGMLEEWFGKLPPLPTSWKDGIVRITPWIALIFGILGVLAGLAGVGLLTFLSPFVFLSSGFSGAAGSIVSAVVGLVGSILLLMAYPGTKKHTMQGWNMLFYSEVASLVAALLSFSVKGVVVVLVGVYLLFQIKSYYKK